MFIVKTITEQDNNLPLKTPSMKCLAPTHKMNPPHARHICTSPLQINQSYSSCHNVFDMGTVLSFRPFPIIRIRLNSKSRSVNFKCDSSLTLPLFRQQYTECLLVLNIAYEEEIS